MKRNSTFLCGNLYRTNYDTRGEKSCVLKCVGKHEFVDIETNKTYLCDIRQIASPHANAGRKTVLECAIHSELLPFWSDSIVTATN